MGFSWIKASVSHVAKFAEDKLVPLHKVCNALFEKPALPHILYFPVSSNKRSFFSVLFLTTDNQIGIFFLSPVKVLAMQNSVLKHPRFVKILKTFYWCLLP